MDTLAHRVVVVIGGGQAGLAIGYHLARAGRQFTILDDADTRQPPGGRAGIR
jgi:putative flavoprotein involved in K+ transport